MTKSRSRVHTRRGHPPPSTGAAAEVDPKGRHLPQLTQVQERTLTQTPQTGMDTQGNILSEFCIWMPALSTHLVYFLIDSNYHFEFVHNVP